MTKLQTAPVYDVFTVAKHLFLQYSVMEFADFGKPPEALPGFLTFFDPGLSTLRLRKSVAGKQLLFSQTWYDNEPFAKLEERARYHQLRMAAVEDSFGKTFAEQQALVTSDAEIPTARVVLMGMAIHFLATGERLFPDCWVRCIDRTSRDHRVYVGYFACNGVYVAHAPPAHSGGNLGVVLARKF